MTVQVVALMAAVLLLGGCPSQEEPSVPLAESAGQVPSRIQARVVEVRPVEVPIQVEVTGTVTAVFHATLSSKVRGVVQDLRVREGAPISKGQTLVVLDSRDLEANVARADAEAENARLHLDRMERLFAVESVAKQELDNARRASKVAEAIVQAARAKLSDTVLKAPFSGVVTDRLVEVGELASPGQPLLTIEDPLQVQLEATVAESDVRAISKGDQIPVVIDALDAGPLEGIVSKVLPSGDPTTHTFLVKVALPPAPGLKTGMFGRLQLTKGTTRTLVIPPGAVLERGQLTGVYALGNGRRAHLRWVKVGRALKPGLEILSGLNAGETILADSSLGVDGAQVDIVDMTATPPPS